jgi:hypothetical protein
MTSLQFDFSMQFGQFVNLQSINWQLINWQSISNQIAGKSNSDVAVRA